MVNKIAIRYLKLQSKWTLSKHIPCLMKYLSFQRILATSRRIPSISTLKIIFLNIKSTKWTNINVHVLFKLTTLRWNFMRSKPNGYFIIIMPDEMNVKVLSFYYHLMHKIKKYKNKEKRRRNIRGKLISFFNGLWTVHIVIISMKFIYFARLSGLNKTKIKIKLSIRQCDNTFQANILCLYFICVCMMFFKWMKIGFCTLANSFDSVTHTHQIKKKGQPKWKVLANISCFNAWKIHGIFLIWLKLRLLNFIYKLHFYYLNT